jgi:predicted enzyme related to lactoylglutathione lyase
MGSPIVHFEVLAPGHKELSEFYASQFGWEMQPIMDEYTLVTTADGSPGGGIGTPFPGHDTMTLFYIQVGSIDEALASIAEAGGKTVKERTEIPGMVTYALFADPAGNVLGIVEAETPAAE